MPKGALRRRRGTLLPAKGTDTHSLNFNIEQKVTNTMTIESTAKNDEPQIGAYAAVGARLCERGYSALPVPPGQKRPGSLKRGEWTGISEWNTEYTRRLPAPLEIQAWSQSAAGVGIVTGGSSNSG
jgi:hypothetical protein